MFHFVTDSKPFKEYSDGAGERKGEPCGRDTENERYQCYNFFLSCVLLT